MFFYVSFLRPPPVECVASSQSVIITPQIANDLRTETYTETVDLHYLWLPTKAPRGVQPPQPRKLTTWHAGSNAYKSVEVPLPSGVQAGDAYRLGLIAVMPSAGAPTSASLATSLDQPLATLGSMPLPVVSAPVQFVRRPGASGATKSEQIERAFMVGSKRVVVREQTSFDLDKKMWDSGLGLSAWLSHLLQQPEPTEAASLLKTSLLTDGCRILELGTGTGFVGLMLHATLASRESVKSASILATDLPSAVPSGCPISVVGAVLDWDEPAIPAAAQDVDVLVMADVTYNTDAFPSLLKTLQGIRFKVLVLGYKQRDPAERELWKSLGRDGTQSPCSKPLGLDLILAEKIVGAGGEPVEVWIGTPPNSTV
ncbi:putative methyltransferase-domain-containing protein [Auriculariales sp. MPI-PUGE-AT-0066]|nr:putative methyltransferase-domain-containing protein [Auriculariales sp. MPI-PUGE-AT-0066]